MCASRVSTNIVFTNMMFLCKSSPSPTRTLLMKTIISQVSYQLVAHTGPK